MPKPKKIRVKIVPQYPEDIDRPLYCNYAQVRFTPNEYLFDFGFVDPVNVDENQMQNEDEISAMVLSRICMNHDVARDFLRALQENMQKFDEISSKIKRISKGKDE